jgi:hypothetical protein
MARHVHAQHGDAAVHARLGAALAPLAIEPGTDGMQTGAHTRPLLSLS